MAKRITWEEIEPLIVDYTDSTGTLGRRQHGYPVRGVEGVYWVESYQWKIRDDGSREPRRYRFVRLEGDDVVAFPFRDPARVLEFDTEQDARDALMNYLET